MKEKIFLKLKQAYSQLGLGDGVLLAHADSLAAIGLVTDENVDSVVSAQKGFLENLQKSNDKRVTDAVAKAKTDAQKEYEDSEAKKKADEEAKKTKELEEQERKDKMNKMPDWYKAEKEASDKRFQEILNGFNSMKEENEKLKLEKSYADRKSSIVSKAKELGIPQWRIDEGFSIADDANDEAIASHLSTVANNVKTQMLPNSNHTFPLSDKAPLPEDVKSIAKSLIK